MVLDIIVVLIFLISTVRGRRRGFVESLVRLAGLVGGIVLGVLFTGQVAQLIELTQFDEFLDEKLTGYFGDDTVVLFDFIPNVISDPLQALGVDSRPMTIEHITDLIIMLIAFLLIIAVVWGIASAVIRHVRKNRREKTVAGTVDSGVGLFFGMLKGVILIFLLLALMIPVAGVFAPDKIQWLNEQLNNSYIAGWLYDVNPLIIFIHELLY
jgi:uncharacterized membrane protein required for colicin V production